MIPGECLWQNQGMETSSFTWITDAYLNVLATNESLASRHHAQRPPATIAELWGESDPGGLIAGAHRFAIEGKQVRLEVEALGLRLALELEPLRSPRGEIVGASGRAKVLARESIVSPIIGEPIVEEVAQLGSWRFEFDTHHLRPSSGLHRLLGLPLGGDIADVRSFDHPEDRAAVRAAIEASGDSYEVEHRVIRHDGEQRYVRERATTIRDAEGFSIARVGTMLDITAIKQRESWLRELANVDTLTGLGNRRLLEERLGAAILRAERFSHSCAALFIDIDGFKEINDTYGHSVGDALLVEFANRLARNVRASDTVTRISGDEFVVVLEDLDGELAAQEAAEKISETLRDPLNVGGKNIHARASIGIAVAPQHGGSVKELLERADIAMYDAKKRGGSRVGGAAPFTKKVPTWSPTLIDGRVSSSKARHLYDTQPNVSRSS